MNYCNYCPCEDCKNGRKDLSHAKTIDGSWICDVCYTYEVCLDAGAIAPCPSKVKCEHRPKLVGEWEK
jgi:hypothetical protein